jgi:hypothetical protein
MLATWQWIVDHKVMMTAALVAALDFAFALAPNLAANGILHQVYLWLKGSSGAPQA